MNIAAYLLEPPYLSKVQALEVARYASGSKARFEKLWQCMIAGGKGYRLCQRAAWCLSISVKQQPDLIYPLLPELVDQLGREDASQALIRNCLRILRDLDIPSALQEKVVYYCFEFAHNPVQPIAIRSFALHILGHIALVLPDIRGEILELIAYHYDNGSSGFKASARNVRKLLGDVDI